MVLGKETDLLCRADIADSESKALEKVSIIFPAFYRSMAFRALSLTNPGPN